MLNQNPLWRYIVVIGMLLLALRGALSPEGAWGIDPRWIYGLSVLLVGGMLLALVVGEVLHQTGSYAILWFIAGSAWTGIGTELCPAWNDDDEAAFQTEDPDGDRRTDVGGASAGPDNRSHAGSPHAQA